MHRVRAAGFAYCVWGSTSKTPDIRFEEVSSFKSKNAFVGRTTRWKWRSELEKWGSQPSHRRTAPACHVAMSPWQIRVHLCSHSAFLPQNKLRIVSAAYPCWIEPGFIAVSARALKQISIPRMKRKTCLPRFTRGKREKEDEESQLKFANLLTC
mmetsp:Transcript_21611/g.88153  ORF Transcript_21611/g.88153 Transcript_21611/m.88153 type:complete len:154 (+) Transcript_21611:1469-1930(+)